MHDQLISSLVLRRQRQIYRIIVARPTNLYAFYRAPIKPSARESILRASVIGGRYDADEIAAIIGDHESRRTRYNRHNRAFKYITVSGGFLPKMTYMCAWSLYIAICVFAMLFVSAKWCPYLLFGFIYRTQRMHYSDTCTHTYRNKYKITTLLIIELSRPFLILLNSNYASWHKKKKNLTNTFL